MWDAATLCVILSKLDDGSFKDSLSALRSCLLLPSTNDSHLIIRCCDKHACFLTDCCLPWLLEASKRETLCSTEVFDIGRLLNCLLDTLRSLKIRLSPAQQTATLKFVWQYWDYPAEATRHQCIRLFENILRLHLDDCLTCLQARTDKSAAWCDWSIGVLETVMNCGEGVRSRYKALLSFATLTSPGALTERLGSDFPERLLFALINRSVTVAVSELLCFLLSGASDAQMQIWTAHLARGLTSDCSWLRSSLKERVIPLLFKNNTRMCISLLEEIVEELKNNANSRTLDARLSIARLRLRFDKSSIESLAWNQLLDEDVLKDSLSHADIELRLSAWHVLSDQPKLSQIISQTDFRLITLFLSTNANEQHPAARHKILTGVKKIFIRLRESGELLMKNDPKSTSIDDYISFLKWLLEFAFGCLREGANIGRRNMGLGILQLLFLEEHLHDAVKSSFFRYANPATWVKKDQISALIAVLDDPFETCQRMALNVLRSLSRDALSFLNFDNILSVAFDDLLSLKARTVHGAAYRLRFYLCAQPSERSSQRAIEVCRQLISRVSERIEFISTALLSIAESQSVFGLLHGVSAVLQSETFVDQNWLTEWREFVSDVLLPICGKVADLVAPVVHSASPEGFLPSDLLLNLKAQDEQTSARMHSKTCQALLVSCWRSQKEMSAIFEQLIRAPFPTVVDQKALAWMSSYYCLQLTECKHFGAFGTAVDGFTRLCEKLWSLPHSPLDEKMSIVPEPQGWLDDIVKSLETGYESIKLCTTRRSAGLPHMVCAILATEPKLREGKSLDETVSRLLVVADSWRQLDTTLCVHAFNVLRVVFRDARLADAVASWAEWGLRTAVKAFGADSWAVRNGGSQLLTALLIRVFGVPQTNDKSLPTVSSARVNCLSAFEFFRRYPSMFEFLLSTLTSPRSSDCLNDEFTLFPAMIILARIYPSLEGPTSLAPFVPHLLRIAFSSRIEKLRVLSTAALAAICEPDDCLLLVRSLRSTLMAETAAPVRQNTINGALLLLNSFVSQANNSSSSVHFEAAVNIVKELKKSTSWLTWCEYNKALFAEILAFVPAEDDVLLKMVEYAKGSLIPPLGRLLARNLLTETSACWQHWRALDARLKRAVIASMAKCAPTEKEQHLLPVVVDELIVCQNEFTLRKLLKILLKFVSSSFSSLKSLVETRQDEISRVLDQLIEAPWILRTSTADKLMLLRSLLGTTMDTTTVGWLEEGTERETLSTRRAALIALRSHLSNWRSLDECVASPPTVSLALLRLLQDEDTLIREETAAVVSGVVHRKSGDGRSLNPVICLRLLVLSMQSSADHSRALSELQSAVRYAAAADDSTDDEDNRLFDPSVTNSYAEWFLLLPQCDAICLNE